MVEKGYPILVLVIMEYNLVEVDGSLILYINSLPLVDRGWCRVGLVYKE